VSEAYTLMHVPVRLVETIQGIASGALVAVPREPTDRMIDAAWSAFYHVEPGDGPAWGEVNNAIRRAMLAAAQPRRDEGNGDG